MAIHDLFNTELKVINIGLTEFADNLQKCRVTAMQVDWRPPAALREETLHILAERAETIESANAAALAKILAGTPFLTGMGRAGAVIPGMSDDTLLHAGPPVAWEQMCGPLRGAIIGALLYEGRAQDPAAAAALAASGKIKFAPCHERGAVGPMAGVVSPSMPVFIIENKKYANRAFTTMNEGLGKVLRYGAYGEPVIKKLQWMKEQLYPLLEATLARMGALDLKSIIAQALHMGDEVHNRNRAATSLFYRAIAPHLVLSAPSSAAAAQVLEFISGNDHFFLNLAMAASKAVLDPARDTAGSSLVVAMARNGTEFGIQLAGTGSAWFTGPAPVPDALFFPGFSKADANPDIGDSAITETAGLGGFAIAAAPAIVQFVGGSAADALEYTRKMYEICVGENGVYQIPQLDFRGTPTGIDAIKVMERNITPFIDTGVAHKEPGVGQVGAGVVSAPIEPFKKAVTALAQRLGGMA